MARAQSNPFAGKGTVEKQVSLSVVPQGPESQDIHVEITRNITSKKRKSQKRFAAFFFAVIVLMVFPMVRDLITYLRMKEEYTLLQKNNQELISVRQRLEEERESLYSGEMIERLAREELDMVMPGESKVYQAIPTGDLPQKENIINGEVYH